MSLAASFRHFATRRHVRPWALCAPILVLVISIPLLRPLHTPDTSLISDDEQSRLATVQAIVEHRTLAIEGTDFADTREKIVVKTGASERMTAHLYSRQPPMLALILSGPYWVMHRFGLTFSRDPSSTVFWLTLLGITIPVALAAALVYRMSRIFELKRPLRALLALVTVIGSGLISYSTVINAHAPAAVLILAAATLLIHVITHDQPRWAAGWLALAGLCAALAATIDPPALVFLALFLLVIGAFRWPVRRRVVGIFLYCLGTALPIAVHAGLNRPITGDLRPGMFHPELAMERLVDDGTKDAGTPEGDKSDAGTRRRGDAGQVEREEKDDKERGPGDEGAGRIAQATGPATPGGVESSELQSPATPSPETAQVQPARKRKTSLTSTTLTALTGDEDDDEPPTRWHNFARGLYRVYSAFLGWHGIFSHFPVMLIGIIGVSLIMHRHWPAATKMLAGTTLGGALAVILIYALCRTTTRDAMFATRWFVVFLPLTLFWAGAWLRRSHRQSSWILAGVLVAFSVGVSLLGATNPLPREGFDRYTVTGAWHNLLHPATPAAFPSALADRGNQEAIPE